MVQIMKDYMASTTAGDMSASSEEQHVEQAIKTFSAQTLSGVQIVDHWYHPVDGTVFALAQLDLEFTLAHRLPMTFSVGYAAGYEEGERLSDEWMISLKIM